VDEWAEGVTDRVQLSGARIPGLRVVGWIFMNGSEWMNGWMDYRSSATVKALSYDFAPTPQLTEQNGRHPSLSLSLSSLCMAGKRLAMRMRGGAKYCTTKGP
jgi:hypothetical protein